MKVLIIEDEAASARRLKKMITEIEPSVEVPAILDSIESSVEWFKNNLEPDLVLLDIHLADGSSFEIFEEVEVNCPVIFTTAYDQYAIRAFKVNSVDYLLKPIRKEELANALRKLKKSQTQSAPRPSWSELVKEMKREDKTYRKRFMIRFGDKIKMVDTAEAAYFHIMDRSVYIRTYSGQDFPIDDSLEQTAGELDPRRFFRINRQMIVNIDAISEMFAWTKARVKIKLKPEYEDDAIVSTERSPEFKEWLSR